MILLTSARFEQAYSLLKTEYSDISNATMSREDANKVMLFYMNELHLDISNLKILHIAGSKGKGTTSMYSECMLRSHGLKTGIFLFCYAIGRSVHVTSYPIYLWAISNQWKDDLQAGLCETLLSHLGQDDGDSKERCILLLIILIIE